jgi:hypothetical protein
MARKKPPVEAADDDTAAEMRAKPKEGARVRISKAEAKKVHEEALKRYKKAASDPTETENRTNYREDMLFTYKPGEQWDEGERKLRGKDRPMYEFNEARVNAMSVINHIRANRPAAKIRGVEEGDKQMAEIRQGLYLNITNNSDFDSVKDYAAGHQVAGGYGIWRIDTEYSADTAFDQDIVIRAGLNPLCFVSDPSDKDELKRNAKYWFVHTKMANDDFDAKYPDAERVSFEHDEDLGDDLDDEESTWVAEYWKKVPTKKVVCLLSDGKTVDKEKIEALPPDVQVVRERTINTHKIVQYIISGKAILEGPNDWAGPDFPFVPVYGYYVVIDGKVYWGGLTRYQKDPQRALNWALTSVYESIANAPQSKYWATPAQAKGNVSQWAEANVKNLPAMLYNPDPQTPGPPVRMPGAEVPVALINAAGMARDALKASVGIFNASLGAQSNETSGKAIRARQDEGMVATFNFGDNMAKSERRTCEIVNRLMPHIYDTERNLRILGRDGSEQYLKINSRDPVTGEVINDMAAGKFDYAVTTGPSFATQRQEAAEFYTGLSQTDPTLMAVAGDLIIKSHDYPMADAIAERKKMMLPPQIQQQLAQQGKQSPEVMAAMAQVERSMQQVQQQGQLVQAAAQEAQEEKNAADKAKADVAVAAANLKVQEAKLAQAVAEFKVLVAEQTVQETVQQGDQAAQEGAQRSAEERQELSLELQAALVGLQQQAADFQNQALAAIAQAQAVSQQAPRSRVSRVERQNGALVPIYEDQPPSRVQRIDRQNGALVPVYEDQQQLGAQ